MTNTRLAFLVKPAATSRYHLSYGTLMKGLCGHVAPKHAIRRCALKPRTKIWNLRSGKCLQPNGSLPGSLSLLLRFKLHVRHDGLKSEDLKPLPSTKTAVDVVADFLAYLFKCARTYIIETHPNGESLWDSIKGRIDVVLSHPNGWEGAQQAQMREAAVMAGIVPDTVTGHARVHFVTEGEASLHYCIDSGLASHFIQVCPTHDSSIVFRRSHRYLYRQAPLR